MQNCRTSQVIRLRLISLMRVQKQLNERPFCCGDLEENWARRQPFESVLPAALFFTRPHGLEMLFKAGDFYEKYYAQQ